ncbi:MAG: glycosyltransferase family 9 protein, partial [Pyrinomonadaceae bacterium]|nr:glycosyltransferase family 9 protein [Pyrinomonadaceae bacterium]
QQLALLGWSGVSVFDKPRTLLKVTETARQSIENKLDFDDFALVHPVAAFDTKQWATENFARIIEFLHDNNLKTVAVATSKERETLSRLKELCRVPIQTFDDLTLPEITALSSRAKIFVGNDSGIAHIASAVQTPSVVIFGSSNVAHWRPFTDAPNEIVTENLPCAPCAGYKCLQFETPHCIEQITVESVTNAVEKVLRESKLNQTLNDDSTWASDQRKHSYYYDDSHGYEIYNPDDDDDDENEK